MGLGAVKHWFASCTPSLWGEIGVDGVWVPSTTGLPRVRRGRYNPRQKFKGPVRSVAN